MKRDWFGETFIQRIPLLIIIFSMMMLYFPINQFNAGRGGVVPRIEAIDGQMPLIAIFVVPYVVGFWAMGLFPLLAAIVFSRSLFQEYMMALFLVVMVGFFFWLAFPAYVEKAPIEQEGFWVDMVKLLHDGDESYGTHNAIPSSHVYYITLAMIYFARHGRRWVLPIAAFAVINALSTLFTWQHYFLDVLAGFALCAVVYTITDKWVIPPLRRLEANQAALAIAPEGGLPKPE
ncbi:MAG: phosphatase PAP2 family protein [Anaerolineales bacterium]